MLSGQRTLQKLSRQEWIVIFLLVGSVIVNYIDRAILSISAPVLQRQLSLSPLQVGSLLSAFFWTYAFFQLFGVAGWFADRFPVGLVFAWGYLSWALATMCTGFLSGFMVLYAARLLLGAGESIAYPCYSRIFAEMPQHHRGMANALIDAGAKTGPAIGTFIGGLLLIQFGWRILFIIVGAVALLWLIPWLRLMPRPRRDQPRRAEFIPPTSELLRVPTAWGTFLGHFCGNYFFYFQLTWLPIYLVRERNLSVAAMTRLTSGLFLGIACATVVAGWISDRLIRHGFTPTQSRKSIAVGGLLVASTLIAFAFIGSSTGSLAVLIVASLGYGAYSSNHWAIGQTLAGPTMAGRWGSVQNGVGNLAGIVAPSVAGFVVQTTGSSRMAFLVTGVIALAGALIWQFGVPRIEPVVWKKQLISQP